MSGASTDLLPLDKILLDFPVSEILMRSVGELCLA